MGNYTNHLLHCEVPKELRDMILCLGTRGDVKTRDGSTQLLEQILGIFKQADGMPFLCALFGASRDNEMHVVSKIMQKRF